MSAIEEFNSEDASKFYSKTFNYFLAFQFIGTAGLLVILKPMMKVIVSSSYYVAWKYIPFLLLAVVYSSLSGFLETTYTAAKRTAGIFLTTFVGAISNILLGFIFVPWLGLQGASFTGFLSFAVVMVIVLFLSRNLVWEQVIELFLFFMILVVKRNLFIEIWYSQKKAK
ncbi:MAG: lipopolysaccharide biosynthesis protein [Leuconostoc falkenbergense]